MFHQHSTICNNLQATRCCLLMNKTESLRVAMSHAQMSRRWLPGARTQAGAFERRRIRRTPRQWASLSCEPVGMAIHLLTESFFTLHNQFVIYGQICVFINIAVYIFMFFGSICHYLKASRLFFWYFSATFKKATISTVNAILHLRLPLQISETSRKPFRILRLNNQNLKTSRNLT